MKKYILKTNPCFRDIAMKFPYSEKKELFSDLWQNKKFKEALDNFPDEWVWLGQDIEKELICDMPLIVGAGTALSQKSFVIINNVFPEETKLNHQFEIDGYKFVWFGPTVVEKQDFDVAESNIFLLKPLYLTVFSEKFVQLWNINGFTGHKFVEIDTPDVNIFNI